MMALIMAALLSAVPMDTDFSRCWVDYDLAANQYELYVCHIHTGGFPLNARVISGPVLSSIASIEESVENYWCATGTCARLVNDITVTVYAPTPAMGSIQVDPFWLENLGRSGFEGPPDDQDDLLPPAAPSAVTIAWNGDGIDVTVSHPSPSDVAVFFVYAYGLSDGSATAFLSPTTAPDMAFSAPSFFVSLDDLISANHSLDPGESLTISVAVYDAAGNGSPSTNSNTLVL